MLEREKAIGLLLPYVGRGGAIFNQSYSTTEQIRTNLKNLILTIKGERWMQPNIGTKVYLRLFEPYTEDMADDIIDDIQSTVDFWMPYVDVSGDKIKVFPASQSDMEKNIITVKIDYTIKYNENITDTITFKFSQEGIYSID